MKKQRSNREMEKVYKRRRIAVSFIAVLIVVLAIWGVVSLGKNLYNRFFLEDEQNQSQELDKKNNEHKENLENSSDNSDDSENSKNNKDIENNDEILINPSSSKGNSNESSEEKPKNPQEEKDKKQQENPSSPEKIDTKPLSELKKDLGQWNLILANPDTPLPKDFVSYTQEVLPGWQIDNRIVDTARKMFNKAKEDGVDLMICSAYRSIARQQELFDNSINGYKAQGYSQEDAIKFTKYYYSIPGQSEHHTGLAMDIVTPTHQVLDAAYEETEAAKWLYNNAYKYGFILRYPKDKEEITKINYEPWHYRYVGVDHANYIFEHKICLEEYLDLLKNA